VDSRVVRNPSAAHRPEIDRKIASAFIRARKPEAEGVLWAHLLLAGMRAPR
jgi:hypothetical protein